MKSVSRTLVKSPPELWQLIDQPDRMQGLMSALLGRATEVKVNERKPESMLRWQAAGDGDPAWIAVVLAEKGWGTRVEVSAESPSEPTKLEGWLCAVLEELATPQKRPFESVDRSPAPKTSAASAPVGAPAESPAARTPPAEDTQADGLKRRRRLFGLL